ncbi:MAG TPA: glycoside hydrolase family 38 C-terminal domain-containing protein [Gemmatimonadaceae bacterium]|nr:glycoside hydrolase family 38 C-terminal domain-containing protein [Gemmatimonadaceae bacterium]
MLSAHVVAHTHWDREWYHPFVRFRQRLVALVDDLLDNPPASDESFLLDGQGIVVEDYLDIRPERVGELAALLQSGRLEAGPWYVLADELIPSGEALVRNLLLGRRVLRRLRAAPPPVLYCPDSFGHPAALPSIAVGFGLPLVVLWRGFGGRRWPQTDTVQWVAAGGDSVVLYHLAPNGYEYGSDLPLDAAAASDRWGRMRSVFESRAATGVVLVPNGADHHARQHRQRDAVRRLAAAGLASGDTVRASSLAAFADELLARARGSDLPRVEGELRDSYGYTWTLQGTFASRAAQKRRNAHAERLLLRDAEPWSALARMRGGVSRAPLLVAAWRTLLQAHPHDTLCGCSIDAVGDAMDHRLDDAMAQGLGIRDDAIADLVGFDAVAARASGKAWTPLVVVRNRSARARGGVAIVEIKQFLADVPVGPGSATATIRRAARTLQPNLGVSCIQLLDRGLGYDRLESPQHYPDEDLVSVTRAAVWVEPVAAYGLTSYPLGKTSRGGRPQPRPVVVTGWSIDNGIVRIAVEASGRIAFSTVDGGRRIDDLIVIEDRVDRGDLYTPSIRQAAATALFVDAKATKKGPLLGELRLRWRLRDAARAARRARDTALTVRLSLTAESSLLRLAISGVNRQRNHRLRVSFRTGVVGGEIWADAAFGAVRRAPIHVPAEETRDETPPSTAPLHRYVSLFSARTGVTLISDGLAEYEATESGELFVTLLRAVGALSRKNLPERPGNAGWPAPTPRAQSLGPFAARLALLLHGPRDPDTIDIIESAAEDLLLPLEGRTMRSPDTVPTASLGVELRGTGLSFSTLKESEDGSGWTVARCVNLLDTPVDGSWRFGTPVREAYSSRLDETLGEPIAVDGDTVRIHAEPRGIVTILVR